MKRRLSPFRAMLVREPRTEFTALAEEDADGVQLEPMLEAKEHVHGIVAAYNAGEAVRHSDHRSRADPW